MLSLSSNIKETYAKGLEDSNTNNLPTYNDNIIIIISELQEVIIWLPKPHFIYYERKKINNMKLIFLRLWQFANLPIIMSCRKELCDPTPWPKTITHLDNATYRAIQKKPLWHKVFISEVGS